MARLKSKKFSRLQKRLGVKRQVFLLVVIFALAYGFSLATFSFELKNFSSAQKDFYYEQFIPQQQLGEYERLVANIKFNLTAVSAKIIPGPGGADKISEQIKEANKIWDSLKIKILNSPHEEIKAEAQKVEKGHASLQEIVSDAREYALNHELESIKEILEDDWVAVIVNIEKPISEIYRLKKDLANHGYQLNIRRTDIFEKTSLATGGALLLLIMTFAYFVGSHLSKSSERTIKILETVNDVSTKNLSQLQRNAEKMSEEIASQSSSMQETVVTLTQINEMIQKSVEIANATSKNMERAEQVTNNGQHSVEKITSYMESFRSSLVNVESKIHENKEEMLGIVKIIENVSNKTALINDIVFQTKLLSFNASVEAARAGDQGKGFSVVAEEVGNLAQMSGNAAKEISSLVNESKEYVISVVNKFQNEMVATISENVDRVEEGVKLAEESSHSFNDIVKALSGVSKHMDGLQQAAREQADGIQNIHDAMAAMERSSLDNTRSAKVNRRLSEEAHDNCDNLARAILNLSETVSGKVGPPKKRKFTEETKPVEIHNDSSPDIKLDKSA